MHDALGGPNLVNPSFLLTFKYANDTSCLFNSKYFPYVVSVI